MHSNFCIILKSHFFICNFIDIDECKGNHSCHEDANCINTNGSHLCDYQPGYTGNGQNCTGEFRITMKCGHKWFILVRSFFSCLYNVFCAPVAKQEQFMAYALDSLCCTNVKKKNCNVSRNGPLFRVNFSKQKSWVIGSPEGFWPKGGGKARNWSRKL